MKPSVWLTQEFERIEAEEKCDPRCDDHCAGCTPDGFHATQLEKKLGLAMTMLRRVEGERA